ncbi:hypothetical protein [Gorillibacterium timonense]|uniref:hypothetical protein n=1 Tax=Gorillibacterium timonense TaxID=1689269 RepID=UPI00071D45DC|nr:hypothetical protein [Gorillibacterium timonense]
MPNLTVTINYRSYVTNTNGEFFASLKPGYYDADVSFLGHEIYNAKINIIEGTNDVNISLKQKLDDLPSNMDNNMDMSNMDMSKDMGNMDMGTHNSMKMSNNNVSNSTNSTDVEEWVVPYSDPGSGGGSTSWHGVTVGGAFGTGAHGIMTLLTADGHVSCNKSSWDNGANFPNNNSDCAIAIMDGLLYLSDAKTFLPYYSWYYCVIESMKTKDGGGANIYCNRQTALSGTKPHVSYFQGYLNLGYNCSSFPMINGDERLNKYNF